MPTSTVVRRPMHHALTIGIAGTAKNTGKTTALNALLGEAHARRVPVSVTSIGYDGESLDNVTGLPKPRIILQPGSIATTSRTCLPERGWEVVETTEWSTALGQILIVRCLEAGPIVLAGPSTRHELAAVVERMRGLGPLLSVIDGALNRLSPMSVATVLVLSTGAARSSDVNVLAEETVAIESILSLPRVSVKTPSSAVEVETPFPRLSDVLMAMRRRGSKHGCVRLNAPVSSEFLREIAHVAGSSDRIECVELADPILALLSDEPVTMSRAFDLCREAGVEIVVERPLRLALVTLCPFLPRYDGRTYVPDAISASMLRSAVTSLVRTPVVDVMQDGGSALWRALEPSWA